MTKNITDYISTTLRRAASSKGGEYHGPCPVCGGKDRFHVWPLQRGYGTFWCRGCGIGGDAIAYLRLIEGMTYKEACYHLGIERKDAFQHTPRYAEADVFSPREATAPINSTWQAKAAALMEHSHNYLLKSDKDISFLADRGISLNEVKRHRLGYLPKDYYRNRQAWGMPLEMKENGKPRQLWLPAGLVIPRVVNGAVHRLRIRRPVGEPRYYVVPGSGSGSWCVTAGSRNPDAAVVVEAELDAVACAGVVDNMHIIALGNSTARPDHIAHLLLSQVPVILVALDFDDAGGKAACRWVKWYGKSKVKRWPTPLGKDPGDAYQQGVDIRQWLMSALQIR